MKHIYNTCSKSNDSDDVIILAAVKKEISASSMSDFAAKTSESRKEKI